MYRFLLSVGSASLCEIYPFGFGFLSVPAPLREIMFLFSSRPPGNQIPGPDRFPTSCMDNSFARVRSGTWITRKRVAPGRAEARNSKYETNFDDCLQLTCYRLSLSSLRSLCETCPFVLAFPCASASLRENVFAFPCAPLRTLREITLFSFPHARSSRAGTR
jgi:hypothetical protein